MFWKGDLNHSLKADRPARGHAPFSFHTRQDCRARLGRGGARGLARRLWVQLGPTCPEAPAVQPARVHDRPQPHEGVRKSVPGLTEDVKVPGARLGG